MLAHVVVLHKQHLKRLLAEYVSYYHPFRTHLALDMDCPQPRAVEPPEAGEVMALPAIGGLHHYDERRAA
jgi:hypothetical protein